MHTRIQLDVTAQISLRTNKEGRFELVFLDGDASTVIEVFAEQADTIRVLIDEEMPDAGDDLLQG